MGSSVTAQCQCGFARAFRIGGGMSTFTTLCRFPALCRTCQAIVSVNLYEKPLQCPECKGADVVPYYDTDLCAERGDTIAASWAVDGMDWNRCALTDGRYYCPSCQSYGLSFHAGGLYWD